MSINTTNSDTLTGARQACHLHLMQNAFARNAGSGYLVAWQSTPDGMEYARIITRLDDMNSGSSGLGRIKSQWHYGISKEESHPRPPDDQWPKPPLDERPPPKPRPEPLPKPDPPSPPDHEPPNDDDQIEQRHADTSFHC